MDKFPLLSRYNIDKEKYIRDITQIEKCKNIKPNINIPSLLKEKFDILDILTEELKQLKLIFFENKFQGSIENINNKQKEIDLITKDINTYKKEVFDFFDITKCAREYYYNLIDDRRLIHEKNTNKTLHAKMLKCYDKYLQTIKDMELSLEKKYIEDVDRVISGLIKEGYTGITRTGTSQRCDFTNN